MHRLIPLFFFVCGAFGQIALDGVCNYEEVNHIKNVSLSQIDGTWNQISRISNKVEVGDCSTLTVSKVNGSELAYFSFSETYNKTATTANGTIQVLEEIPGMFVMNFLNNITLKFVSLTTNHSGIAVLYSCYAWQNSTKSVYAWQYSRNATLSSHETDVLNSIVSVNSDLKNAAWRQVNHNSTVCPGTGNGMRVPIPHVLILALVFLGKAFV